MMLGSLNTDLEEYDAIQKNINYHRMLQRQGILQKYQSEFDSKFEKATSFIIGHKQSERKTLFSTIIDTQTAVQKVHSRRSVINKVPSPMKRRLTKVDRASLYPHGPQDHCHE